MENGKKNFCRLCKSYEQNPELLEAHKLFNIPQNKLDILIHPNSLVHAIVVLKNGLTKFIYHDTSMVVYCKCNF